MSNIIPKDSRYIPMTQQKSCCVPACFSIIMYKLKIPLIPQELFGYYLGLKVAPKSKKLFWNARSGKRRKSGYGTNLHYKDYKPEVVFKKLNIPLEINMLNVDNFETKNDFLDFVVDKIKKDKHLIVCFDHGTLSGEIDKHGGHTTVVDQIYPSKNEIRLIDPSPNRPKWRVVNIARLYKAMKLHPAGGGGVWEFKKVKK